MCVRQLLEHTSGLPAWAPLYEDSPGAGLIDAALALPRESEPGAEHRYSDIGFLVLGAVLEAAAGCGLEELIQREVLIPLGLRSTGFRNSGSGQAAQERALVEGHFAATERCPYRGLLCGEVHDDNCWSMGGVGPHAGLFAPASDVAAFAQGIWDAEEQGYLPRSVLDLLWAAGARGHRLGWDTVSDEDSSAGKLLSRRARGHLGFTGTSLWIDPERALAVVLLTNRVHHGRDALGIRRLRPCVHDAVASHRPVL